MYKRVVLVVDDQVVNQKSLYDLLCNEYHVLTASNGKEALKIIKEHEDTLSAMILDDDMPVMNGYEVLDAMKKDMSLSKIPVIVSSEGDWSNAEIKALTLGAQDFILKPFKADIIHHRLENMIKLRETSAIINNTERDELTGLYNKQFFMEKVQELLKNNPTEEFDLLCVGIEHFKLVNDTYGVGEGDKVLCYLGDIIKEVCASYNICSRFEADQFYGILPHKDVYENERMRFWQKKMNNVPIDMDIKLHCGIYYIHNKSVAITAMCDRALLAAAKNRGKYDELFYVYDDSIRKKLFEEQFITSNMQVALEQNQFQVYYQPKYDLNTETITGAEALVRWIHPERGFISPGDFIPLFEKNGFITQLDQYVWKTVCQDTRYWLNCGYPPIAISVNVSRADIYNPKLIDFLLQLIDTYQVPLRYFHLEITESAYTENPKQIISVVEKLRKLGFLIEMDDFGSGYSSLNMLADMPVDVLKLDMGFIQSQTKASSGKGILSFVISLAKWLNLAVVAEGVETKEQILVLRSMDCNYAQGFYYARPMERRAFEELIQSAMIADMVCTNELPVMDSIATVGDNAKANIPVILIVDDQEIDCEMLTSIFADEYIIKRQKNGQEAWKYLKYNYDKVSLIMLDLLMPIMDGFHLIELIRSTKETQNIPVIITSQDGIDREIRAFKMSADDFISKPFNPYIVRQRVKNVLAGRELKKLRQALKVSIE